MLWIMNGVILIILAGLAIYFIKEFKHQIKN